MRVPSIGVLLALVVVFAALALEFGRLAINVHEH